MSKDEGRRRPFGKVTTVAVPINQANVDTDQIIPARFLSLQPRGHGAASFL